jgi:hypothetical protein
MRMALNRQTVSQYIQLSCHRNMWPELVIAPGAYPQATAQSFYRFMCRVIASVETCRMFITKIVIKMLSSWYVTGRPTDPAASKDRNSSECNTIKSGSGSKPNSWTIWDEKMKGF